MKSKDEYQDKTWNKHQNIYQELLKVNREEAVLYFIAYMASEHSRRNNKCKYNLIKTIARQSRKAKKKTRRMYHFWEVES